ncbi:MAG: DUF4832 domain-containing protein [Bacteroidales bacterium]|nr:DUF4832 domain-containing protein [Bacteroidales bacterium]
MRTTLKLKLFIIAFGCLFINTSMAQTPITINYVSDNSLFANPERGFYVQILHGGDFSQGTLQTYKNQNMSIVLYSIYLTSFTSSPISSQFLTAFQNNLNSIRTAGMKTVLRFAYSSTSTADATLEQMQAHLDQLQPYLASNVDIIMIMQAGFVGQWGEFQGSDNFGSDSWPPNLSSTNKAKRKALIDKCLAVMPVNRFVQVRQPWIKREFYRTTALQDNEKFNGSSIARIGHFNDCFLDGNTDAGTYYDKAAEYPYLQQETKWLPMGGESCALSSPYTDCPNALTQVASLHWSFMNSGYHQGVLSGWQTQGCYNTIAKNLGYRFSIVNGEFSDSIQPGNSFHLKLSIANTGYAATFNSRPVEIIFRSVSNPATKFTFNLADDPRLWLSGDTAIIDSIISIPVNVPQGKYEVLLNFPDPESSISNRPEYSIRLANQNVWETTTGYNRLFTKFVVGPPAAPDAAFCNLSQAPVIDGVEESAWSSITTQTLSKVIFGTVSSSTDLSADYKAMWDNTALYLLVKVKDDVLKNDSGTNTWDDDALEIFVDGNNDKATSYDVNDHQYIIRWNDATVYEYHNGGTTLNPAGVTFSQGVNTGGYLMEIKITWSAIGVTPAQGKLIGFDLHTDDDDDGGTIDKIISWFASDVSVSSNNPSTFGTIQLSGTSCGGVTTVHIKEENKNSIVIYPNPFNTDFTLIFSSEIIRKNAMIKIYDVCGKEVKTILINDNETIIERGELQNGIYFYQVINNNESINKGKLVIQ